jgi:hypothetical protein
MEWVPLYMCVLIPLIYVLFSRYMCALPLYICVLRCDYCEGVRGVGIVNAVEVVRAFPTTEGLVEFRKWMYSREPFDFAKGCTDAELVCICVLINVSSYMCPHICVLILLCCASGCTRESPSTSLKAAQMRSWSVYVCPHICVLIYVSSYYYVAQVDVLEGAVGLDFANGCA